MGMVFKFRVLSDENEEFQREYELRYDSDLAEFHRIICDDLSFDAGEMSSFFLSGPGWEKGREFTLFSINTDDGGPQPMEGTLLGNIVRKEKARLIYTFDIFSDRSLYIELAGTYKETPGRHYPCVTHRAGNPPPQFDLTGLIEGESVFEEALGEFGNFEGDDFYDDEI